MISAAAFSLLRHLFSGVIDGGGADDEKPVPSKMCRLDDPPPPSASDRAAMVKRT